MTTGVAASNLAKTTVLSRLQKGLAASLFGHGVSMAHALLLTPLFLRAWGADGYGRWLALSALAGYITLLDFGGQTYIGNLLAITYAEGDANQFRRRWEEGLSLYGLVAFVALAIIVVLLALPNVVLPGQSAPLATSDRWVLGLLAASNLLAIVGAVYMTPYRSTGLLARGTVVGNLMRLLAFCVFAGVLYAQAGLWVFAVVILVTTVITAIVIAVDMRHALDVALRFRITLDAARRGLAHLRGSLEFWLIALAAAINQQGVILVVSASISPTAVALFSTHRAMASLVSYVGTFLNAPLTPELSFFWGQRRLDEMGRAMLLTVRLVALASGAAIIIIWVWLPLLYPLWTGHELTLDPRLLAVLLFQALLYAGWSTAGWVLLAANRHSRLVGWSVANALITIVAALLLVKPYGTLGVALASLLGDVLCGVFVYPRLAAGFLEMPSRRLYGAMLVGGLALLPLVGAIALAALVVQGWALAIVASLLGLALAYPTLRAVAGRETMARLWASARESLARLRRAS